jgi:hypothetical protein
MQRTLPRRRSPSCLVRIRILRIRTLCRKIRGRSLQLWPLHTGSDPAVVGLGRRGRGNQMRGPPSLKRSVWINNFQVIFDNRVCTEYGNGIYKHIFLVIGTVLLHVQSLQQEVIPLCPVCPSVLFLDFFLSLINQFPMAACND